MSNHTETIEWAVSARIFREALEKAGAGGIEVRVYCPRDLSVPNSVELSHPVYETATLTMEEAQLVLGHLQYGMGAEAVFVMAQAIADSVDMGVAYNYATGKLVAPHARRKAVAA